MIYQVKIYTVYCDQKVNVTAYFKVKISVHKFVFFFSQLKIFIIYHHVHLFHFLRILHLCTVFKLFIRGCCTIKNFVRMGVDNRLPWRVDGRMRLSDRCWTRQVKCRWVLDTWNDDKGWLLLRTLCLPLIWPSHPL